MPLNLLALENLFDINEQIKIRASKDPRVEYTGSEDYPIKIRELKKLIELTPKNRSVVEIAAYYLKNIILLQAFPTIEQHWQQRKDSWKRTVTASIIRL